MIWRENEGTSHSSQGRENQKRKNRKDVFTYSANIPRAGLDREASIISGKSSGKKFVQFSVLLFAFIKLGSIYFCHPALGFLICKMVIIALPNS